MFLVYFHSQVSSTGLLFLNAQCWKLLNENKPKTFGLFRKVVYFWFIFEINQISFKNFGHVLLFAGFFLPAPGGAGAAPWRGIRKSCQNMIDARRIYFAQRELFTTEIVRGRDREIERYRQRHENK